VKPDAKPLELQEIRFALPNAKHEPELFFGHILFI